jgi:hypothetical protein
MRWWWILIGVSVSLGSGCDRAESGDSAPTANSKSTAPESELNTRWPVLVVDAQHAMRDERSPTKPYVLEATGGVTLDARGMMFNDPAKLARSPNAVQVLYGPNVYTTKWPTPGMMQAATLDGTTLRAIKGPEFKGFETGTPVYIAIGYESDDDRQKEKPRFEPFWAASVIVR